VTKTGFTTFRESRESIQRSELAKLRLLAKEAADRGDYAEARKMDRLADQHAQLPLFAPKGSRKADPTPTLIEGAPGVRSPLLPPSKRK
jgi:hypothetical protein